MHSTRIPVDVNQMLGQPLFESLDEDSVAEISRGGWVIEEKRAARVLARGDHLDGLFVVMDGRLKLYMLSCNGDERVLRVLQAGDSFGEAIMFNELPSPVFVDTLSPVRLAYFPRDVISAALTANPNFMTAMLASMSALMRNLIHDLETCCLQNAMQRTVNYLLRESGETLEVALPAPKAVVASTLNLSAETFSRELHRLQAVGYINIDRRNIHLTDRDALTALAEGSSLPLPAVTAR